MTTKPNQWMDILQQACRETGLKLTPQRVEIYQALAESDDHPTAERLHQVLLQRLPTLSLDTVYRTLSTFCEMGLAHRVETAESQARYEIAHSEHHHLICEQCKKIIDFEWPEVDQADLPPKVQANGHFSRKNVVVYGICNTCLKR